MAAKNDQRSLAADHLRNGLAVIPMAAVLPVSRARVWRQIRYTLNGSATPAR